jgi:Na+-translocating ferredoxin:NAD+ oxidoreductase RnfA subunit
VTGFVPLVAGGLLALAEICFAIGQREGVRHHLFWALGSGLGGVVVSALVLLVATAGVRRSLPMTVAGTAAAVIAVALLSRAWRSPGSN